MSFFSKRGNPSWVRPSLPPPQRGWSNLFLIDRIASSLRSSQWRNMDRDIADWFVFVGGFSESLRAFVRQSSFADRIATSLHSSQWRDADELLHRRTPCNDKYLPIATPLSQTGARKCGCRWGEQHFWEGRAEPLRHCERNYTTLGNFVTLVELSSVWSGNLLWMRSSLRVFGGELYIIPNFCIGEEI